MVTCSETRRLRQEQVVVERPSTVFGMRQPEVCLTHPCREVCNTWTPECGRQRRGVG